MRATDQRGELCDVRASGGEEEPGARGGVGWCGGSARPARSHAIRWAAAVAGVAVAVLGVVLALDPSHAAVEANSPLLGKQAPPLAARDLGGSPVRLSGYRGRFVVVNFFASWCPPCRTEAAALEAFYHQHRHPGGATVLGVAWANDTRRTAGGFMSVTGASWRAVLDPTAAAELAWGVRAPPETFVVAPSGVVVAKFDGPVTQGQLNAVLARARLAPS